MLALPGCLMNKIKIMLLVCLYGLLFYFVFTHPIVIDYSSFYSSTQALLQGENPYQSLYTTYFPTLKQVSINLNPPIVLMMFIPFAKMSYSASLMLWSLMSLILGLISVSLTFSLSFTPAFLKQHRAALYALYFAFAPTLINTSIGQLGNVIAFLIVAGYYFFTKKRENMAAILWGTIISMKFFPALLFFFALQQHRYKMMAIMAATILTISAIPGFIYGMHIYTDYFSMLSKVPWYGNNWNGSMIGFLFRILAGPVPDPSDCLLIKYLYIPFFLCTLAWYLHILFAPAHEKNHQAFALTLVMMLLMSPLGWIYYFPLISLPLCLTWSEANHPHAKKLFPCIWILCLFFINFPINYVPVKHIVTFIEILSLQSFYFYGLCLLAYLLTYQINNKKKPPPLTSNQLIIPVQMILAFGIIILCCEFIYEFMSSTFVVTPRHQL